MSEEQVPPTELEVAQAKVIELKNAQAKACYAAIQAILEEFNCFQDVAYTEPPAMLNGSWVTPAPKIIVKSR